MQKIEPIKLTVFLDILGFSEMIKKIDNEEKSIEFISKFDVLKVYNRLTNEKMKSHSLFEPYNLAELYSIKVLFVSDSIIISYMPNRDFILKKIEDIESLNAEIFVLMTIVIAQLQILTINVFNRFLRGGICDEFSYIEGMHAVGKGITDAYKLESQIAKYPRVIFKKEILKKYNIQRYINSIDETTFFSIQFYTTNEEEEYAYINYLNTFDLYKKNEENILLPDNSVIKECTDFIILQSKIIDKELKKSQDKKIYEKYKWLENSQRKSIMRIIANPYLSEYMRRVYPDEFNTVIQKNLIYNNIEISLYQKIVFYIKKVFFCLKRINK